MLQVHRLEGFYWVARTGGYARAARAFPYPITQPAVHQQVKKLEAELGLALFERVGRDRMLLTPAGARLFEFVRPFYEGLPALARSLAHGERRGELRVRAAALFVRRLLPEWVRRIHKRWPGIRVELEEGRGELLDGLRRGECDLVVDWVTEEPTDVATMRVATLHPFVVLPRDHPLAARKRVGPAELADVAFLEYGPGPARDLQREALARHGVAPARTLSASSAETILGFVAAELGWSLLPWLDERGPREKGVVARPLRSPRVDLPVVAAWRKDTPENPLLDAALETAPRV